MPKESNSNALEVTVTELSANLKRTVEDTFGHVRVRGEVSGYRGPHSSGHCYFSLKDERARLEAVIWKGVASRLKHMPEEGLEVIASGKLTTYPGSSKYQIVIDNIEPAGAGALMALLEERRKKLAAEGLFEEGRKQLLPYMPRVIAVITSPTGAVIRDILHRLTDRFPVHVLVWPVRVQGETSGREVANGIHQLNNLPLDGPIPRPDMIIVARGGGSLEDLWGFNDEALVRATADSMIPIIAAVGHETDWTLIDHAADWRAPTPTAAAERAVPVKADLEASLADLGARLRGGISRLITKQTSNLRSAARGLKTPDMLLAMPRRQFDEAAARLNREFEMRVQRAADRFSNRAGKLSVESLILSIERARENYSSRARQIRLAPLQDQLGRGKNTLSGLGRQLVARIEGQLSVAREKVGKSERLLNNLSYEEVLARGYAIIRDQHGQLLTGVKDAMMGDLLEVEMSDGRLNSVVESHSDSESKTIQQKPKPSPKSIKKPAIDQGDLF
ncbi:MAG: exodeoxyribonuclease VII large subunit [Rhizobiaceae bacterium]